MVGICEQPDRRIDMRKIVLRMRNLRLVDRNPTVDLSSLEGILAPP